MTWTQGKHEAPPEVVERYLTLVEMEARILAGIGDPNSDLFNNEYANGIIEEIGNAIFLMRERWDI